jgi:hypothetical protein
VRFAHAIALTFALAHVHQFHKRSLMRSLLPTHASVHSHERFATDARRKEDSSAKEKRSLLVSKCPAWCREMHSPCNATDLSPCPTNDVSSREVFIVP